MTNYDVPKYGFEPKTFPKNEVENPFKDVTTHAELVARMVAIAQHFQAAAERLLKENQPGISNSLNTLATPLSEMVVPAPALVGEPLMPATQQIDAAPLTEPDPKEKTVLETLQVSIQEFDQFLAQTDPSLQFAQDLFKRTEASIQFQLHRMKSLQLETTEKQTIINSFKTIMQKYILIIDRITSNDEIKNYGPNTRKITDWVTLKNDVTNKLSNADIPLNENNIELLVARLRIFLSTLETRPTN